MWFLWRTLQISCTAKKPNKTVLKEADTSRSLINKICKVRQPFSACEEGTFCDNKNDSRRTLLGKTAAKDAG